MFKYCELFGNTGGQKNSHMPISETYKYVTSTAHGFCRCEKAEELETGGCPGPRAITRVPPKGEREAEGQRGRSVALEAEVRVGRAAGHRMQATSRNWKR